MKKRVKIIILMSLLCASLAVLSGCKLKELKEIYSALSEGFEAQESGEGTDSDALDSVQSDVTELTEEIVQDAFANFEQNSRITSSRIGKEDGVVYSIVVSARCGEDLEWTHSIPEQFSITTYIVDGEEYMDYYFFTENSSMAQESYGRIIQENDKEEDSDDSSQETESSTEEESEGMFGRLTEILEIDGWTARVLTLTDKKREHELLLEVDPATKRIIKITEEREYFILETVVEYITEIKVPDSIRNSSTEISYEEASLIYSLGNYIEALYGMPKVQLEPEEENTEEEAES